MNQKELKELIEFLIEKDIAEFELERGDVKVKIKRAGAHTVVYAPAEMHRPMAGSAPEPRQTSSAASPAVSSSPAVPASAVAAPTEDLHVVKSPIVGTFYEAPSPGAPPFVKVGDSVEPGQVLTIHEWTGALSSHPTMRAGERLLLLLAAPLVGDLDEGPEGSALPFFQLFSGVRLRVVGSTVVDDFIAKNCNLRPNIRMAHRIVRGCRS